jgi:hypothetical protein
MEHADEAVRQHSGQRVIVELSIATGMVLATVVIHAVGLYSVARLLRVEEREEAAAHIHPLSLRGVGTTLVVVLSLIALHGTEIWLYAFVYQLLGAVTGGLREAMYFSTTTYGAIGYDDAAMAEKWKLVSAIEGINGIILIGWSTAFFVMIVARMRRI